MVRLKVTGANTFVWIATKYIHEDNYNTTCIKIFRMSCFTGTSALDKDLFTVELVAEFIGK